MIAVEKVGVELGPRSYDIHVGRGLLAAAGHRLRPVLRQPRIVILTDETVARLHLATLARALDEAGIAHGSILLPPGERTKSFEYLEQVVDALLERRIERDTMLVALGGGVIGDLGGFAASIVLRGIDFAQIPTTLLSQVDSSVGGKSAIDTKWGKNLVGAFHQPRLVLADIDTLTTLPRRELLAGYAEVVKYGLIDNPTFFAWLEDHGAALIDGDETARQHAVKVACESKARIVAADEREGGVRALLNLGHTFAHALEAECGFGDELLHGEAVAIGLVMAFDLSARLGLCSAADAARVERHLGAIGLPTEPTSIAGRVWDPTRLMDHMRHDKKVRDGKITFVLARAIGQAFIARDVDPAEVRGLLEHEIAA
ncbi:MAG: 3-dehydroquinate synthase [Dongiaceae bacterium]